MVLYVQNVQNLKDACPRRGKKKMMNETNICKKAIKKWGEKQQTIQAIEELAELQVLLARGTRKNRHVPYDKILEEIADVEIMMTQLKVMFDARDKFIKIKDKKLLKLWELTRA